MRPVHITEVMTEEGALDGNGAGTALSGLMRFTQLGNVSPVRKRKEKHKTTVDTD